jgi:hypothetical protein
MLHHVNVNAGPQRVRHSLTIGPLDDLLYSEVARGRIVTLQKASRDPNFVSYFNSGFA